MVRNFSNQYCLQLLKPRFNCIILRLERNCCHCAGGNCRCIFCRCKSLYLDSKFTKVPKCSTDNNKSALIQTRAWYCRCDKSLPEPKMTQITDAIPCHLDLNRWCVKQLYSFSWKIYTLTCGFKHCVPCIVRSEARRGQEYQSVHEARSAECTDVSKWPASDLTMHGTPCLNPIMTLIIWFQYIMKPKFATDVPERGAANHVL